MTHASGDVLGALWAQSWQIAALALVVAVVVRRFCRHRPQLAYLLWMVVLVKCLTPPIWSSPVGLFSWARVDVQAEAPRRGPPAGRGLFQGAPGAAARRQARLPGGAGGPAPRETAAVWSRLWAWWRPALVIGWIGGALVLAGLTAARWACCWRAVARGASRADVELKRRVDGLARRLGVRRAIRVVLVDRPIGPAVFGLWRPTLVVPRALAARRRFDEIEPIVAHELVHVRRHDAAMLAVELVAKIVWWFHPLVWWASREAGRERERSCDAETVAGLNCRPATYARALLDVLELKQQLRMAFVLPGVRPGEVTSKRLEDIMKRATRVGGRAWGAWAMAVVAALLVLPGGPMVITTAAEADSAISEAELADKLAKLEGACWEAGLTAEESEAVEKLAKRMKADEKAILRLKALGKLSDVEARAADKLIRHFGNPLEEELAEVEQMGQEAGLSEAEVKALQDLAVRYAFDEDAILAGYEAGKGSPVERAGIAKLIDHFGHPYPEHVEAVVKIGKAAKLTDAETATVRGLLARAKWDPAEVLKLKQAKKLSAKEAAAVAKAEAALGKLEYYVDLADDGEEVRVLFKLAQMAGLSDAETDAVMALAKEIDFRERAALERKQAGKLSELEAAGIAKLEALLGDLEDVVDSPHRDKVGELFELAGKADLSLDESKALLELAIRADFDRDSIEQMYDASRLSDLELRAVEKLAPLVE